MREALEAVFALNAIGELRREHLQEARARAKETEIHRFMGEGDFAEAGPPKAKTVSGEEGAAVADTPHIIEGWDEWNELELAETDPAKEPLEIRT